jgi:AcrR family transcriptional regulator
MTGTKDDPQRRERKKKAIRDSIFKTAQKLFVDKGFENTNYFPRKEDLLAEIFKRKIPFLKRKCQEILELDVPIKTKINKIFSTTARIAAKHENITRAMLIKNFSTLSNQKYDGVFFEDFRSSLALILKQGQVEGHMREDVSAIKLATMLEGIFTLFVIDCLIKKTYRMSSRELYIRLNICLEGMSITTKVE